MLVDLALVDVDWGPWSPTEAIRERERRLLMTAGVTICPDSRGCDVALTFCGAGASIG